MRCSVVLFAAFAGCVSLPWLALADPSPAYTATQAPGTYLLQTSATQAPVMPAAPGQQTSSTASDPDQIVCKAGVPPIGSRIPAARECHTQRQWDQEREDAQKALAGSQIRGLGSALPGGN
jgi:hypothetical protein